MITPSDAARFRSRLAPSGDCLVWTGGKTRGGYGQFNVSRKVAGGKPRGRRAHRAAWEIAHGSIPDGLDVLHRCDNPPCCKLDHLWLGTKSDNMRDMFAKRRDAWHTKPERMRAGAAKAGETLRLHGARGEKHANAKLTDAQVAEILAVWRPFKGPAASRGFVTVEQLAARYGVSRSLVCKIVRGVLRKPVGPHSSAQKEAV